MTLVYAAFTLYTLYLLVFGFLDKGNRLPYFKRFVKVGVLVAVAGFVASFFPETFNTNLLELELGHQVDLTGFNS